MGGCQSRCSSARLSAEAAVSPLGARLFLISVPEESLKNRSCRRRGGARNVERGMEKGRRAEDSNIPINHRRRRSDRKRPNPFIPHPSGPNPFIPHPSGPNPSTPQALIPSSLTPQGLIPSSLTPQALIPSPLTPQALIPPSLTPQALIPPSLTPQALIPPPLTHQALIPPPLTP
ncbi:hypothetical protein JOQ06_004004 [Pogonophryne albipinna]|uniref:Uncharacterized protein n=1 Tax=Pogonophryne albipinna TaxID=1090488 RepID=A0AAD6ADI2_9TELE|nr:hypothetical protein JOQ06_004004 [Pogonophryne albipinna]